MLTLAYDQAVFIVVLILHSCWSSQVLLSDYDINFGVKD